MRETWVWSLGQEDPLEKGMATHSSILAWRIPWTEEPGRLQRGSKESDTTERLTLSLSFCQCRRQEFDYWPGKIPHVVEQVSPSATTIEPVLYSPGATTTELLLLLRHFSCVPRPCDSPDKNTGVGCHFLLRCMKVKSERAPTSKARAPQQEKLQQWDAHTSQPESSPCSAQPEKAHAEQWRPCRVINKLLLKRKNNNVLFHYNLGSRRQTGL